MKTLDFLSFRFYIIFIVNVYLTSCDHEELDQREEPGVPGGKSREAWFLTGEVFHGPILSEVM